VRKNYVKNQTSCLKKLNKVGYYESDSNKHTRLANKYHDYVNAIGSKSADRLPKREHGWYLSKDD